MLKVGTLSQFLFQVYVTASIQCKNCLAQDESYLGLPNMLWFDRKNLVPAPAGYKTHTTTVTTMAGASRNGPLMPQIKASSHATTCFMDGQWPPKQAVIILGGVRGYTAIKALLCSGDDASPQHRSVLRAIHPLNLQKIICKCSGGLPPSSNDDGAGRKASCGVQGGHFFRCRPWSVLVEMVVVGRWRLVISYFL